ncbi:MAG TPA: aspartate kinase [Anaeromyxobacteraceae bacterium]|nr:aspartate kinase [Anaeromyxobacteraceae bacterium]
MPVVVQKYGGSSVADVGKIRQVAAKVAAARRAGQDVCVVVSAMGKTTDGLIELAKQVSAAPARREMDMLLSAGERISMALLSMALNDLGIPAISFTGSQSGIITTGSHTSARILEVRPVRVREELARGRVVIVAGFQGVSPGKEVTTLGRGGSDTTAVAMAAALQADCEIYSDVDGVYTADPRVVAAPRRLDRISYEEMQELARAGARVLNAQAVEFARASGIAIRARATGGGGAETVVQGSPAAGPARVVGVTSQRSLALLDLAEGALEGALRLLDENGAAPQESWRAAGRAHLALQLENVHGWGEIRERLARELSGDLAIADAGVGSVSVVGAACGGSDRIRREVEAALSALGTPPRAVLASPLRVTAYLDAAAAPEAVRRLHARLVESAA